MKKSNFIAMVMGIIGGLLFALGMCMVLIEEWNAQKCGIVAGAVGLVILIAMIFVKRKMDGKEIKMPSKKVFGGIAIGIIGAFLLGIGMCLSMAFEHMALGIIIGVVGIVVLLILIPYIKGLK